MIGPSLIEPRRSSDGEEAKGPKDVDVSDATPGEPEKKCGSHDRARYDEAEHERCGDGVGSNGGVHGAEIRRLTEVEGYAS